MMCSTGSNRKYYKPKPKQKKECEVCNAVFESWVKHAKTCSPQCSKELTRLRAKNYNFYKDGRGVTKYLTCKTCGSSFTTNSKRTYCSERCQPGYKEPFNDKLNRVCLSCGSDYIPHQRNQKYCNRKCQPYRTKHGDTFYQSQDWKSTRASFIAGYTHINGINISNKYCIECYRKQNRLNDMYAVDHIVRRKDGGSDDHSNLQSLCKYHHQSKSATEGNKERTNWGGRPKRAEGEGCIETL